jgi:hypothetical protein
MLEVGRLEGAMRSPALICNPARLAELRDKRARLLHRVELLKRTTFEAELAEPDQ